LDIVINPVKSLITNSKAEEPPSFFRSFKKKRSAFWILGGYIFYHLAKYSYWRHKNKRIVRLYTSIRQERDAKVINFNTEGLDIDLILSLDIAGLREHLIKGTFTSVNLVNVFG